MKTIKHLIQNASTKNFKGADYFKESVEELINKGDVRVFVEEDVDFTINIKLFVRPNEQYGGGPVETGDELNISGDRLDIQVILDCLRREGIVCKHTLSDERFAEKLADFAEVNGFEYLGGGRIKGPRGEYSFSVQNYPRQDNVQFGSNGVYYSWESLYSFLTDKVAHV